MLPFFSNRGPRFSLSVIITFLAIYFTVLNYVVLGHLVGSIVILDLTRSVCTMSGITDYNYYYLLLL